MKYAIIAVLALTAAGMAQEEIGLDIMSKDTFFLETSNWNPPIPVSSIILGTGDIDLSLGSLIAGNGVELSRDRWTVRLTAGGIPVAEELEAEPGTYMIDAADGRMTQSVTKFDSGGNILWNCVLEGTDDFDNQIKLFPLEQGGLFVVSQPDCWSTGTYIAMISPDGELEWTSFVRSDYLLDFSRGEGEIYPKISMVRETAQGDFLVCGSVARWVTASDAMFICLIDGDTGEPLWKTTHHISGEARADDICVTASDMIVAVGSTAKTAHPDGSSSINIWSDETRPFIVVTGLDGFIYGTGVFDGLELEGFTGIIETARGSGEFLLLGRERTVDPACLTVVRAELTAEVFE